MIALALVVVVMKQASNESLYHPFFAPTGTGTSPQPSVGPATADPDSRSRPSSLSTSSSSSSSSASASGQTSPLDAAFEQAIGRVIDGSVWRGGDFDAFYQALNFAAGDAAMPEPTVVGVVPMLQQPDVFRGRVVAIAGTVARSEKLPARENEFGIQSYWQLWLRPIGGADRPFVAIVPEVPDRVAAIGPEASTQNGPGVHVVGVFLKRLAYRSSIGADLAPVVIGRLDRPAVSDPATVQTGSTGDAITTTPPTTTLPTTMGWTLMAACVVGIAVAGIVSWRMSVMTRHSRTLRTSGQPDRGDFFDRLKFDRLKQEQERQQQQEPE